MSTPQQTRMAPHDAVGYWTQVANTMAEIRRDLERTVPTAPEGTQGMNEDAMHALEEAFDEALLAADAVLGMCHRLAGQQNQGVPNGRQSRVRHSGPPPVQGHPMPVAGTY